MKYLYSYIDKNNYQLIKKYGLLSLYGLYHVGLIDKFVNSAEKYLDRGRMERSHLSKDDLRKNPEIFFQLFDKANGKNASKVIWFLCEPVTPGLHKERDKFVNQMILTKIPLDVFQPDWTYYGLGIVSSRQWTPLTLKDVLKMKKTMNQKIFEKKKGGRFLFSHVPHLAIAPLNGRIDSKDIIFEKKE